MSTLTLLAILIQLADAGQTCAGLRNGDAREANPGLGSRPSCARVFAMKGAALAPLAFPLTPKFRLAAQVGNIGGGAIGIGFSVKFYWGAR